MTGISIGEHSTSSSQDAPSNSSPYNMEKFVHDLSEVISTSKKTNAELLTSNEKLRELGKQLDAAKNEISDLQKRNETLGTFIREIDTMTGARGEGQTALIRFVHDLEEKIASLVASEISLRVPTSSPSFSSAPSPSFPAPSAPAPAKIVKYQCAMSAALDMQLKELGVQRSLIEQIVVEQDGCPSAIITGNVILGSIWGEQITFDDICNMPPIMIISRDALKTRTLLQNAGYEGTICFARQDGKRIFALHDWNSYFISYGGKVFSCDSARTIAEGRARLAELVNLHPLSFCRVFYDGQHFCTSDDVSVHSKFHIFKDASIPFDVQLIAKKYIPYGCNFFVRQLGYSPVTVFSSKYSRDCLTLLACGKSSISYPGLVYLTDAISKTEPKTMGDFFSARLSEHGIDRKMINGFVIGGTLISGDIIIESALGIRFDPSDYKETPPISILTSPSVHLSSEQMLFQYGYKLVETICSNQSSRSVFSTNGKPLFQVLSGKGAEPESHPYQFGRNYYDGKHFTFLDYFKLKNRQHVTVCSHSKDGEKCDCPPALLQRYVSHGFETIRAAYVSSVPDQGYETKQSFLGSASIIGIPASSVSSPQSSSGPVPPVVPSVVPSVATTSPASTTQSIDEFYASYSKECGVDEIIRTIVEHSDSVKLPTLFTGDFVRENILCKRFPKRGIVSESIFVFTYLPETVELILSSFGYSKNCGRAVVTVGTLTNRSLNDPNCDLSLWEHGSRATIGIERVPNRDFIVIPCTTKQQHNKSYTLSQKLKEVFLQRKLHFWFNGCTFKVDDYNEFRYWTNEIYPDLDFNAPNGHIAKPESKNPNKARLRQSWSLKDSATSSGASSETSSAASSGETMFDSFKREVKEHGLPYAMVEEILSLHNNYFMGEIISNSIAGVHGKISNPVIIVSVRPQAVIDVLKRSGYSDTMLCLQTLSLPVKSTIFSKPDGGCFVCVCETSTSIFELSSLIFEDQKHAAYFDGQFFYANNIRAIKSDIKSGVSTGTGEAVLDNKLFVQFLPSAQTILLDSPVSK